MRYRTVAIPASDYGSYGVDKLSQQGSLSWAEGDATPKTLTIPIPDNDMLQEAPGEEFFVELYGEPLALSAGKLFFVTLEPGVD